MNTQKPVTYDIPADLEHGLLNLQALFYSMTHMAETGSEIDGETVAGLGSIGIGIVHDMQVAIGIREPEQCGVTPSKPATTAETDHGSFLNPTGVTMQEDGVLIETTVPLSHGEFGQIVAAALQNKKTIQETAARAFKLGIDPHLWVSEDFAWEPKNLANLQRSA